MNNSPTWLFGIMACLGWGVALYQQRKIARVEKCFYELCVLTKEDLDSVRVEKLSPTDTKLYSKTVGLIEEILQ